MNPEPIIEINDLTTYLGGNFIHKSLNLTIYRNEILAVVGGSGSGKTTLLRSILMLLPLYSGTIKVFGHDIEHSSEATLKKIQQSWGVLFQHSALFSSLTTLENVMFPLQEKTGLPQNSIVELAKLKLNLVGFPLDSIHKYPAELSGGMQKRAGLARAIALDPELLFLDEPTTGLDPEGATSLDELVISLKNDLGLTIVIVTHDLDTLWSVADRVAVIGEKIFFLF
ncbi:MAG: ABC transporter ATP-binding protein [Gammaproteobacteria bacterium]